MFKKIVLIISILFLFCGCEKKMNQDDDIERIHLEDKYYNKGDFIKVESNDLKDENYVLFIYNSYCSFSVPCDDIFDSFMKKYDIDFLSMPFDKFKETKYYGTVKYAPSIIIFEKGNIIAYLDAESDEDLNRYQDTTAFEEWMNKYVYFTK